MTPCTHKAVQHEVESMQNEDVGMGMGKVVACCQPCLGVSFIYKCKNH